MEEPSAVSSYRSKSLKSIDTVLSSETGADSYIFESPHQPDKDEETMKASARLESKTPDLQIIGNIADLTRRHPDATHVDLKDPSDERDPSQPGMKMSSIEYRVQLMFSRNHMQAILDETHALSQFARFLHSQQRSSIHILERYLVIQKALLAIEYSNNVLTKLKPSPDEGPTFSCPPLTENSALKSNMADLLDILATKDLPDYVTSIWIKAVSASIQYRISGLAQNADKDLDGLAEVFCLTDPSQEDSPIVLVSEEFHRTTQYGFEYVIGRNCRFLQGPYTTPSSTSRISQCLKDGKDHHETILNYRRDGSAFLNLLLISPLYDSEGKLCYFFGAQVDVSGLAMACYGLSALKSMTEKIDSGLEPDKRDALAQLVELMEPAESSLCERFSGRKGLPTPWSVISSESEAQADRTNTSGKTPSRRIVLSGPHSAGRPVTKPDAGLLENSSTSDIPRSLAEAFSDYLIVGPHPTWQVLFASRRMRYPGIVKSNFLDRIDPTDNMRDRLKMALENGSKVTARVNWLPISHAKSSGDSILSIGKSMQSIPWEVLLKLDEDSVTALPITYKPRWVHCTPLIGDGGQIGMWVVVIVS